MIILMCNSEAATVFGPVPYHQRSDSPFYAGLQQGSFLFENFEDQQLNTPGVSINYGNPDQDQGVDEDDGVVDGMSRNWVWATIGTNFEERGQQWSTEIKFAQDSLQGYPRWNDPES